MILLFALFLNRLTSDPLPDLAHFHTQMCQSAVGLTVGKDHLRELIPSNGAHIIGCFRLPLDSSASAYAPSENPLSPLDSDYHSAHMPPSEMSEDHLVPMDHLSTLKSTVDSMMSQSEATKNLLNTILKRLGPAPGLLNATASNLTRHPESCPSTPIPTPTAGQKKTFLKPSTPLEFDSNCTKGKAFLSSCQTYICLESIHNDYIKIIWAMSYMKSGWAGHWATREFEYEGTSQDGRLCFPDWVNFEDEFHKDLMPLNAEATAINVLETTLLDPQPPPHPNFPRSKSQKKCSLSSRAASSRVFTTYTKKTCPQERESTSKDGGEKWDGEETKSGLTMPG
jgi:hypothetical protein